MTDIKEILAENDPFNSLSEDELKFLLADLKIQKDKLGEKLSIMVRKWKTTKQEKTELSNQYVKLSNQIRSIEARLKSFDK